MFSLRPVQLTIRLARLRWQLPLLMVVTGLAYALGDHLFPLQYEYSWFHLLFGVFVLGVIGPVLAWRTLVWATVAARERDAAERELGARNEQCSAVNAIARAVNRSLDLDQVLNLALDQMLNLWNVCPSRGRALR